MSDDNLLQFVPFASALEAGFWYQLTKKKLEVFKLDDKPVEIQAFYSNSGPTGSPCIVNIDYSSLEVDTAVSPGSFGLRGTLINTNTIEDFKLKDKKDLLRSVGQKIWKSITDESALENPTNLQSLVCLTFAELKKYHFYYWIGFPALVYPRVTKCGEIRGIYDYFSSEQVTQILNSYDSLELSHKTAFLICKKSNDECCVSELKHYREIKNSCSQILVGFTDPSSLEKYPGWPLRNLLALVAYHWSNDQKEWDVLCFRTNVREGRRHCEHSIIIPIQLDSTSISDEDCPDVVGWEKNKNKLAPRKVDMSANMDPKKLANSAVDLNLKLMRWRLSPDLKLEKIQSSRCLLFGAGTLGCNVARCLMGWGVKKITFVDNSKVSFSNPVRQTLFTFEDCLGGGQFKATTASKALQGIFPGIDSEGYVLSVPMPGHSVPENMVDQTKLDVSKIEELVENHDVIFLLMDSRESRWLPSLLAAHRGKLVINAALGFDTFLVMRHGLKLPNTSGGDIGSKIIEGYDLGCYFCNDIVAPGNSLQDRTLDQQCTVTRPGVSYLAAALAVELMVSVLQHPKGGHVAASTIDIPNTFDPELSTDLGLVPHQIRGYLDRFQNTLLTSKAFDCCTACSNKVIEEYNKEGFSFLLKVLNDPCHLEEITGLTKLMTTISMDEVLELSDDDSA
ncbi:ubiquitin-like modifier-activating enzyme ATG7 [Parasteatoda tepidariorum]|uniref:ubiquitin-like modifier-activating enzyme ATG7 n=1 Tax=Parasteatoda tepidariorum TaxID=114398 RepID=UPI00077FD961|nr:ubiquitin-like modifier-activating enzyme ATG7 [Parasteatoda tepidariorum]